MLSDTVAMKHVSVEHFIWVVQIEICFKCKIHTDFKDLVQKDSVKYFTERQLDIYIQKNEFRPLPHTVYKN